MNVILKFKHMDDEFFDEFTALNISNDDEKIEIKIDKNIADKLKDNGLTIVERCPNFLSNEKTNTKEFEKEFNEYYKKNVEYYFIQNKNINTSSKEYQYLISEFYNWIKNDIPTKNGDYITSTEAHECTYDTIGRRQNNDKLDIYVDNVLLK